MLLNNNQKDNQQESNLYQAIRLICQSLFTSKEVENYNRCIHSLIQMFIYNSDAYQYILLPLSLQHFIQSMSNKICLTLTDKINESEVLIIPFKDCMLTSSQLLYLISSLSQSNGCSKVALSQLLAAIESFIIQLLKINNQEYINLLVSILQCYLRIIQHIKNHSFYQHSLLFIFNICYQYQIDPLCYQLVCDLIRINTQYINDITFQKQMLIAIHDLLFEQDKYQQFYKICNISSSSSKVILTIEKKFFVIFYHHYKLYHHIN